MKLHLNCGHAPAQQENRALVDSDGESMHLVNHVGEVLEQREACRASDEASRAPKAGTSTVSSFLDDVIALHVMGAFSKYSSLLPIRSTNPQEAWDVFCNPRIGIFGRPKSIQMDEGGVCGYRA